MSNILIQQSRPSPICKWQRVLFALAKGHSFNRFEAERLLHDHCLHSTISSIQKHGIIVSRKNENVPGYQGILTSVRRYWLEPSERYKASVFLGNHKKTRGSNGLK